VPLFTVSGLLLLPYNLLHEYTEFLVSDLSLLFAIDFSKHLLEFVSFEVPAFSLEAFFEVLESNDSGVVDIEVMECELQVGFCDSSLAIDADSKELGVVDLSIMVQIDVVENLVELCGWNVHVTERFTNLRHF